MKRVRIMPLKRPVKAVVEVPGSKSYTNRALLLAAMSPQPVRIINPLFSDDTEAMVACLSKLGIKITAKAGVIDVIGSVSDVKDTDFELDADLSGTTIRFLLALCTIIPGRQTLQGRAGLNARPMGGLVDGLRQLGAKIDYLGREGHPPIRVSSSRLKSGAVKLDGSQSSQYLSALLMIAPAVGNVTVEIVGELVSAPFADMTIETMERFNVKAASQTAHKQYYFDAKQAYICSEYLVEGDVSSASYFFAIAALTGSTLTVKNLNPKSKQADMNFLKILKKMGNVVERGNSGITVIGKGVKPVGVNMQDCPDQAQTLAVLAAFVSGTTKISGIQSLRVKETERLAALESELHKMGIKTSSTPSSLQIQGGAPKPASIATYGDHRMAMAFAVAGTKLPGMEVQDPLVVAKTFPDFWDKLVSIGISLETTEQNIVLIGMRGSGKSVVAEKLAHKLENMELIDLDTIMSDRLGMSTAEVVATRGWDYFRDQESAIAKDV
ncbi:MAG TPA: 3-phosphoshikimate 1-carboxyvinyltransferase, partial [Candidatus Dormibacteraeota bacterium]|nr:3-phosphoshikimate 1-carboxyvinyltransferase [Candidatus Dormibacteraeota bacterium]